MLRVLEIVAVVAIVVYGFIKLLEMFVGWRIRYKKATALDKLHKQAQKNAKEKSDILDETKRTEEKINKINDTLN